MSIIFNPLSPEDVKKIGEYFEKRIKFTKTSKIIILGVCFLSVSLIAFLLSSTAIGLGYIRGYELVFKYGLVSAKVFLVLHCLTLLMLIIPRFPDKFQFATLFTLINIPLLFFIYYEVGQKITRSSNTVNESIVCFFMLMFCWIMFGLETYKTSPKIIWFKWLAGINDKMQREFDQGIVSEPVLDRVRKAKSKKTVIRQILFLTQCVIGIMALFLLFFEVNWKYIFAAGFIMESGTAIILGYILFNIRK